MSKYFLEIYDQNKGCIWHTAATKKWKHNGRSEEELEKWAREELDAYVEETYFDYESLGKPDKICERTGEDLWLIEGGDPKEVEDYYPADHLLDGPMWKPQVRVTYGQCFDPLVEIEW